MFKFACVIPQGFGLLLNKLYYYCRSYILTLHIKKLCKIKVTLDLFYQAMFLCNYTKVVWLWWYTPRYLFLLRVSQFMAKIQFGQELLPWWNVSRPRFDQHIGQLTNLWQWMALTLTTFSQSNLSQKVYNQMTVFCPRFDQEFLGKVVSVWIYFTITGTTLISNFNFSLFLIYDKAQYHKGIFAVEIP